MQANTLRHLAATPLEARAQTGADAMWQALVNEAVDVVFGYPGGAIMPAYDAMPRYPVHHVLVRHEQGAAHMADGYARVSGRVGVVLATSGPGATNLTTGIANAMLDSVAMVCITGQVASSFLGTDAFQETDITGVTLPITKHNFRVTRAEDIAPTLHEAFAIAREGRPGPVLVDITKDAQMARIEDRDGAPRPRLASERTARKREQARHNALSRVSEEFGSYEDNLRRASDLLANAERPVVLAGHGISMAGAEKELMELVERCDLPVASTLLGLGSFPASHVRSLGMMGMHGEAWVNSAIQNSDLLIAVGMRFDDRVTGTLSSYAPRARKIHIELDPAEINKNVKVDVALLGDAKSSLRALVDASAWTRNPTWLEHIERLREGSPTENFVGEEREGLHPAHVIREIHRLTGGNAIVVTDVGQHQMWEAQHFMHERSRTLLTSGGLGTMGFALPAAIGARFADREQEVWVIAGDGGFQMTACELTTIAQEGIKLNIAIINNGYLGMVRQWQELFFEGRYVSTPIRAPDFVKLAEAHGLTGLRVERREDLEDVIEEARRHPESVVVDFRVAPEDNVYPIVPTGKALDQMLHHSSREETSNQHPSTTDTFTSKGTSS